LSLKLPSQAIHNKARSHLLSKLSNCHHGGHKKIRVPPATQPAIPPPINIMSGVWNPCLQILPVCKFSVGCMAAELLAMNLGRAHKTTKYMDALLQTHASAYYERNREPARPLVYKRNCRPGPTRGPPSPFSAELYVYAARLVDLLMRDVRACARVRAPASRPVDALTPMRNAESSRIAAAAAAGCTQQSRQESTQGSNTKQVYEHPA
jgi:hypothetical protein